MTYRSLMLFIMVSLSLWLMPGEVLAATSCSASIDDIEFNVVDPRGRTTSRTTISYDCGSIAFGWVNASMCLAIDPATGGAGSGWPMRNSFNDELAFQLYTDAARTAPWGNNGSNRIQVALRYLAFIWGSGVGSVDVYGLIPPQPEMAAGDFTGAHSIRLSYQFTEGSDTPPASCTGGGSSSFQLTARASVPDSCRVLTASDLDFSPGAPLIGTRTGRLASTSAINLSCRKRTAWKVALDQGRHAQGGFRHMKNETGSALIRYRLSQDPAGGLPWDDGANTRNADPANDTGTGAHALTVYGEVPDQPLVQAGHYSDTVKVTVTY